MHCTGFSGCCYLLKDKINLICEINSTWNYQYGTLIVYVVYTLSYCSVLLNVFIENQGRLYLEGKSMHMLEKISLSLKIQTKIMFVTFKKSYYQRRKKKIPTVFKTHLNPSVFFKVKITTIQQWSTNKLKYHTIFFDNCSADLQRTVVPFSLQDTEYIWFKQSNTVEIQKQNRKKIWKVELL